MEAQKAVHIDCYDLSQFILDHYKTVHDWTPKEVLTFVEWYVVNGLCFYRKDISLLLLRPCFDVQTVQLYPRVFNPHGDKLYVDLYISTIGIDIQSYFDMWKKYFSDKKYIAFGRDFRHNVHFHKVTTFMKTY